MNDDNDDNDESMLPSPEPDTARPVRATRAAALELPPELTAGAGESGTRALLRDAIQKVMDEIERHEREAKRHLQQAQELRKELRESVAFLQAGGQSAKTTAPTPAGEAAGKTRARDSEAKAPRAGGKKGAAGKRK